MATSLCLSVRSFVCRLKRVVVGRWPTGPAVLAVVSGQSADGPVVSAAQIADAISPRRHQYDGGDFSHRQFWPDSRVFKNFLTNLEIFSL